MVDKAVEIIKEEGRLFSLLKEALSKQKEAMINKDVDAMREYLNETERIVSEIDYVDTERHKVFTNLKKLLELPEDSSLETLINSLPNGDKEKFSDAVMDFLLVLNDLAAELQGLKEIIEFENSYFEFLMNLISGGDNRSTYSRAGKDMATTAGKNSVFDVRW